MIKITVAQSTIKEVKGISAKSGKPYHMRFQTAYAHTVDKDGNPPPYPEKFEVILDTDAPPFTPGDYTLSPSALFIDKDGRLQCAPRLTPLRAKPAA